MLLEKQRRRWRVGLQMAITYKAWFGALFYPLTFLLMLDKVRISTRDTVYWTSIDHGVWRWFGAVQCSTDLNIDVNVSLESTARLIIHSIAICRRRTVLPRPDGQPAATSVPANGVSLLGRVSRAAGAALSELLGRVPHPVRRDRGLHLPRPTRSRVCVRIRGFARLVASGDGAVPSTPVRGG